MKTNANACDHASEKVLCRVSYRMSEIPRVTGRGLSTAYRDAKAGRLKVQKCGRSTMVLHEDLLAWLTGQAAGELHAGPSQHEHGRCRLHSAVELIEEMRR
jgi:hypothetical protein